MASNFDPDLNIGTTRAIFQRVGNLPVLSDIQNIRAKTGTRRSPNAFSTAEGMPSGPHENDGLTRFRALYRQLGYRIPDAGHPRPETVPQDIRTLIRVAALP